MSQTAHKTVEIKGALFRSFEVRADDADLEARTLELSFSSEQPYERYFGVEILGHNASEVRMDRLRTAGPLLFNHDRDAHIGRVLEARIENGRGVAKVRFSSSEEARQKLQDVRDGILREVSVGYRIHAMEMQSVRDGVETYRVTDWEPLEVSLVSIPADTSVGVGRSIEDAPYRVSVKTSIQEIPKMSIEINEQVAAAKQGETARLVELTKTRALLASRGNAVSDETFEQAVREGWDANKLAYNQIVSTPQAQRGADGKILAEMQRAENRQFMARDVFRAMSENRPVSGFEGEVCAEMRKSWQASGLTPSGVVIPREVLRTPIVENTRTQVAGVFADGGATVATNLGGMVDLFKNAPLTSRLGVRRLTGLQGNLALPRKTGASTARWVAEASQITSSKLTFDDIPLVPKGLGITVVYTKQFLAQTSISAEAEMRRDMNEELELAVDTAYFVGTGVQGQPLGLLRKPTGSTAGTVQTVTFSGAPTWRKAVEFETRMQDRNSNRGTRRWVSTPSVMGAWKTTTKDTGSGLFLIENNACNGYEFFDTNLLGSEFAGRVVFGNFLDSVIAEWAGIDVTVDPYTLSDSGRVRITALTHVDLAFQHLESFVVSTDAGNQ